MTDAAEAVALRDPDTMSEQDLREEVWFWRENAAAGLGFARVDLKIAREMKKGGIGALKKRIDEFVSMLTSALTGDLHEGCGACGFSIRPGDACIWYEDIGEAHAACPAFEGGPQAAQVGDRIEMEPEAIVWEGEGPPPDHLVAHAHDRLYTTAVIATKIGLTSPEAAAA
jgi:hypothetical protein